MMRRWRVIFGKVAHERVGAESRTRLVAVRAIRPFAKCAKNGAPRFAVGAGESKTWVGHPPTILCFDFGIVLRYVQLRMAPNGPTEEDYG
jgi:hypothetical protein